MRKRHSISATKGPFRSGLVIIGIANLLCGCGATVPQIREFYEGPDVAKSAYNDVELQIKEKIFCELVSALVDVRRDSSIGGVSPLPNNYGVQMQINLTVEETGALNPSITLNNTLRNATVLGVTVPQSFNLGATGTVSSTATRTDTSYSYYIVGRIAKKENSEACKGVGPFPGSTPFLISELGIKNYLEGAVASAAVLPSSPLAKSSGRSGGGAGVSADANGKKIDIYSYEIKFVIVSDGSITPTWKLVNVSANNGTLPLVSAGRTRTHDLILTFGPSTGQGLQSALQTHFTNQIVHAHGD